MFGMEQIVHAGMIVSNLAEHGQDQDVIFSKKQLLNQEKCGVLETQDVVGQEVSVNARLKKSLKLVSKLHHQQFKEQALTGVYSNKFRTLS